MFIAHVKECGEGCDYTIGCGHRLITLQATTKEEAIIELKNSIMGEDDDDEYGLYCYDLEKITLYEVKEVTSMPIAEWYIDKKNAEEEELANQKEQEELKELERLQKKYGK